MKKPHVTDLSSNFFILEGLFFTVFVGNNIWRTTFHNYSLDLFNVSAYQIGFIFALTSVPGVMAFSLGLLAPKAGVYQLLALAASLVGLGLIGLGGAPTWEFAIIGVVAISIGFVFFYPVVNTVILLDSEPEKIALKLGRLKSFGPLAAVAAGFSILLLQATLGYRLFFIVMGLLILAFGVLTIIYIKDKQYSVIHGKLRLSKALWPYYALNFLSGSRSALFKSFVLFLLIKEYGFELKSTATIVILANLFGFLGYRILGKLTQINNRRMISSIIYVCVALIFIGFSTATHWWVISILFILDSLLFSTSVITDSYLKDKSSDEYFTGDLATGLTIFYSAGVIVPIFGGWTWETLGYQATFLLGSLFAVLSIWVSQKL